MITSAPDLLMLVATWDEINATTKPCFNGSTSSNVVSRLNAPAAAPWWSIAYSPDTFDMDVLETVRGMKYNPKHLVDEHGVVGKGILGLPHQVQVGQAWFHHQHVCSLRNIPSGGTLSKASRATGKLVLFPVTKGRGRLCGLAERSVEAGGELDGVAQDRDPVAKAIVC